MENIIVKLPDGRRVQMEPLSVKSAEIIAGDYTPEEIQNGLQTVFSRDLIAASIVKIDDIPVDHAKFNARKEFTTIKAWNRLSRAYEKLNHTDVLQEFIDDNEVSAESESEEIKLPSGKTVTVKSLSLDEIEAVEQKSSKKRSNFLALRHNMAAASVTHFEGQPLNDGTNLRIELPCFFDWNLLCAAFDCLNSEMETEDDFLESIPAS